jgi:hypothetical protein
MMRGPGVPRRMAIFTVGLRRAHPVRTSEKFRDSVQRRV